MSLIVWNKKFYVTFAINVICEMNSNVNTVKHCGENVSHTFMDMALRQYILTGTKDKLKERVY